jgi:nicotinamide phosphoribosyltransferase
MDNILLLTDSYKISHWRQYPKGTKKVYSYLESRGGKFDKTVFFGLQYFIKRYLTGKVLTQEKIDEAAKYYEMHLGPGLFNKEGFQRMLEKHDGKLPVVIKAVPEGSVVEVSNVLVTIENTDDEFPWLTNFLETLLVNVW